MSHAGAQPAQSRQPLALTQHDFLLEVRQLQIPELLLLPEHDDLAVEETAHDRQALDIEIGEGLASLAEQIKGLCLAVLDQGVDRDLFEIVFSKMSWKLFQGVAH